MRRALLRLWDTFRCIGCAIVRLGVKTLFSRLGGACAGESQEDLGKLERIRKTGEVKENSNRTQTELKRDKNEQRDPETAASPGLHRGFTEISGIVGGSNQFWARGKEKTKRERTKTEKGNTGRMPRGKKIL